MLLHTGTNLQELTLGERSGEFRHLVRLGPDVLWLWRPA